MKHYSLTTLYTDPNPSFPASNTRLYVIRFLCHPRLMSRSHLFPGLPSPFPLLQHNKLFCTGNPRLPLRELVRTRLHRTLRSYFTFQRGILCLPSKSLIFHSCCSLLASGCNLCLCLSLPLFFVYVCGRFHRISSVSSYTANLHSYLLIWFLYWKRNRARFIFQ